jgi:hypothetical protein
VSRRTMMILAEIEPMRRKFVARMVCRYDE